MILTKTTSILAVILLVIMASLMLGIASQKTTIVDESPHIVAGYTYVAKQDYRINPEHPPLIKAIAAVPLLFRNLNFPEGSTAWTQDVNGQWMLGAQFLHEAGNDPVSLTFWARLGPIFITLLLGVFLFIWARKLYGLIAGLFSLTLFVFSPTFLAHGPLVTTDVGAVFAFFIATFYLFRYLEKQNKKNLLLAGVAFGIAQLLKFSLILLIPYFTVVVILWVLFKDRPLKLFSFYTCRRMGIYLIKLSMIGFIGLLVVYPVYQFTVLNYPVQRQYSDAQQILTSSPYRLDYENEPDGSTPLIQPEVSAPGIVLWMADKPVLRAYSQFFMGHLMVFQRVQGGNTVYFLGDIASTAWWYYFPLVFLLKVPLALLVLMAIAAFSILHAATRQFKINTQGFPEFKNKIRRLLRLFSEWMNTYFIEVSFGLFIVFYWAVSMVGNLNIGVRHVLPTFPFMYLIITAAIRAWVHKGITFKGLHPLQILGTFVYTMAKQWIKFAVIILLLLWYSLSSLSVFPHSLAYFNEIVGGPSKGYMYVVDSNLDWGQDLQGLTDYVNENNIDKIRVQYFGGGSPSYYLGDKFEDLDPNNIEHRQGWIAVSGTLLQGGRGIATKSFKGSTQHYMWLNDYEPITVIGHSIFVYYIE